MSDSKTKSKGTGFLGLLTLVFIVLKLTGTIDWSWWWVLAPFWIPLALILVIGSLIGLGAYFIEKWQK